METNRIKKAIAILLVVVFLVTVTEGSASAWYSNGKIVGAPEKETSSVQFTDKSTGSPTSLRWDFGDGVHSTLKNPVHKYKSDRVIFLPG